MSGSPTCRLSCGRAGERWSLRPPTACRRSSRWRTYGVCFTATPTSRTGGARSKRWRRPPSVGATAISGWRTTPGAHLTLAGLSVERIQEQHRLADRLNRRYRDGFRILKGIESDILQDGSLDYPDEVLASFPSWSRACTAGFDLTRKHKPSELFERSQIPSRRFWAT
jgi:hypothetical protein